MIQIVKRTSNDNRTAINILNHLDQGIALLDNQLKPVFKNRIFKNLVLRYAKEDRLPAIISMHVYEYIKSFSEKWAVYKLSEPGHKPLYLTVKGYKEESKQFYLLTLSKMRLREYDLFLLLATEYNITPQHFQIIRFLSKGCSAAEIAKLLNIAPPTVKYHLSHLYDIFYVSNRAELLGRIEELAEQAST